MTRGKRSWDKRLDIDALKQWRQRIDATDAEIVRLLNQRARIAQEIGNARTIRLKRGWDEPSIIWPAITGDSGTLKSPVYLKAVDYLFRIQKRKLDEYKAAVKTKAFVISLVLVPVLWTVSIGVQVLLHKAEDRSTKKFAVVDRTPDRQVTAAIRAGLKVHNEVWVYDRETGEQTEPKFEIVPIDPSAPDRDSVLRQRYDLSQRCQAGEFEGVLDIGPDVYALETPSKDRAAPETLRAL